MSALAVFVQQAARWGPESYACGCWWAHTNLWADGQLIANYSASTDSNGNPNGTLQFLLNDWLGTRRTTTDYSGLREQSCASLPYGDGETCASVPTERLFTGKERDQESHSEHE